MNSEAINNKTTFIILHKDKKHITKKLLKYLSRYYPNENYIFADGDCNDELSAFIECLNFKSLIYFHQEDLSVTHFFRKIQKALNYEQLIDHFVCHYLYYQETLPKEVEVLYNQLLPIH